MSPMTLKLGKTPARPGAVSFRLVDYIWKDALPKPPAHFGHEVIERDYGMLGNDSVGDCVIAGACHETMLWNHEAGTSVAFDDACALRNYSDITGYDPNDPNSDQGTDMAVAAAYRRKTGIVDANGVRHQVAAYLAIEPGNIVEHYYALYLFGAVGIGINFPSSAMDQFNKGKPWSVVKGAQIEGGHYVPLVAKRTHLECVTWGGLQSMTAAFFEKYNDESICYVSTEALHGGKTPEGFDAAALLADLSKLPHA